MSAPPGVPAADGLRLGDYLARGRKVVDGDVVALFANRGYADMLLNALSSIRAVRPHHDPCVFVFDAETREDMSRHGVDCMLYRSGLEPPPWVESIRSPEWRRIVLNKLDIVRLLLLEGLGVLYSDVDVVWLRDPFPPIRGTGPRGCVLWIQTEADMLCSGFFYAKPSDRTIELFDTSGPDVGEYPRPGDSRIDQPLIDARIRRMTDLAYQVLPPDRFPAGPLWYSSHRRIRTSACIVHFNGITTKRRKVRRMRKYGMWSMDAGAPALVRLARWLASRLG